MIDGGLENVIKCTIKYEMSGEYTDVEIAKYVLHFQNNYGSIWDKIKMLPIVAS